MPVDVQASSTNGARKPGHKVGSPLPVTLQRVLAGRRWRGARRMRQHRAWAAAVDLRHVARFAPTGVGVITDLYDARDVFGQPWGFLHLPATGHSSLVLQCELDAGALDNAGEADLWLAQLGLWLAMLAHEPDLQACTVTLDRPPGSWDLRVQMQLTYYLLSPGGSDEPAALAAEVGARIPQLVRSLAEVGDVAAATGQNLRSVITSAYRSAEPSGLPATGGRRRRSDTTSRSALLPPTQLTVQDDWSYVRHHDGATSRTWSLSQLASSVVLSSALSPLIAITPDVAGVRISLSSEPTTPTSRYDPSEWTGLSQTASGHPAGAPDDMRGAPAFSVRITATVPRPPMLPAAARAVRGCLAPDVQPWLRPVYGDQAAAFAAGTPLGLVPASHALPPRSLAPSAPRRAVGTDVSRSTRLRRTR